MKKSFYIGVGLIVFLIVSLLAYGVYLNKRSETNIAQRTAENRLPLHGARVQMRNIFPMLKVEMLNLYSKNMVDITALVDGKVNNFFVAQNDFVREGQAVVELINDEVPLQLKQAESDIIQAQANLTRAENTFKRYSELLTMDAISKQKFDEAKADFESAQAVLESSIAKRDQLAIRKDRQVITASIGGEILRLYKQVGSYVTAGTPIALIGNFDTLYFDTKLFSDVDEKIDIGQVVEVHFSDHESFDKSYGAHYAAGNLGGQQIFNATLIDISPPFSQSAFLRKLTWQIDNSVGLLEPGFYNGAHIHFTFPRYCLTIPENNTVDDNDNYVFIAEDGILKMRKIVTGFSDGNFIQIVSGLNEGDIVITSSTSGLSEGLPVDVTIDEGGNELGRRF